MCGSMPRLFRPLACTVRELQSCAVQRARSHTRVHAHTRARFAQCCTQCINKTNTSFRATQPHKLAASLPCTQPQRPLRSHAVGVIAFRWSQCVTDSGRTVGGLHCSTAYVPVRVESGVAYRRTLVSASLIDTCAARACALLVSGVITMTLVTVM